MLRSLVAIAALPHLAKEEIDAKVSGMLWKYYAFDVRVVRERDIFPHLLERVIESENSA